MTDDANHDLGDYRDYLLVLARSQIAVDLRGRIDPSDVVQETIYKALCAEPRKRERAQTIAWLRKVLHDKLVDRFRRLRLERGGEASDDPLDHTSAGMSNLVKASQSSPEARAIREEDAQVVTILLGQLTPAQAEVVVLKYCRGMSVAEISRHVNKTPDAIGGLLRHGLRRLRELIPRED